MCIRDSPVFSLWSAPCACRGRHVELPARRPHRRGRDPRPRRPAGALLARAQGWLQRDPVRPLRQGADGGPLPQ
eukprot:9567066-Lingulodinium_polyedra.AAC.1